MKKALNRLSKGDKATRLIEQSRAYKIAKVGINSSQEFTALFSGLMADLAEEKITASIANAMCNAGGKVLKMVELEIRYGQQVPGVGRRRLMISGTFEPGPEQPPGKE